MLRRIIICCVAGASLSALAGEWPSTSELHVAKSGWEKFGRGAVKVGDFVEYTDVARGGMKVRKEVVEIGDHTFTIKNTSSLDGKPLPEFKVKMIYDDAKDVQGRDPATNTETQLAEENVTIAKGTFNAVCIKTYVAGALVSKEWFSKDIPAEGIVKRECNGKEDIILTNFGHGN